jgi:hypothetical protein
MPASAIFAAPRRPSAAGETEQGYNRTNTTERVSFGRTSLSLSKITQGEITGG